MKNTITRVFILLAASIFLLCGCQKDDEGPKAELLAGTWFASDGFYYIFHPDNTGRCQDEDEYGLDFEWNLTDDELEIRYKSNGQIDKPGTEIYVIVRLSDNYMRAYEIAFPDIPITFDKQDE